MPNRNRSFSQRMQDASATSTRNMQMRKSPPIFDGRSLATARAALLLSTAVLSVPALCGCGTLAPFEQSASPREATATAEIPPPDFEADDPAFTPADAPRVASGRSSGRALISAPPPFSWTSAARSAGDLAIQTVTVGNGERQTLVIGSLAGHDPVAIRLTEQLARYLHHNELVVGGVSVTVIRNANPDGETAQTHLNADGATPHRGFPADGRRLDDVEGLAPEVRFVLEQVQTRQPHRIIHVRTIAGSRGLVAADSAAINPARELADWLQFALVELPGQSAQGTLERCISSRGICEIVTIAIPAETPHEHLWTTCGDALLNLLLDDDFAARLTARHSESPTSADRRSRKTRELPVLDQPTGNFSEPDSPRNTQPGSPDGADDLPPVP